MRLRITIALLLLSGCACSTFGETTLFGPTAYLSSADVPAGFVCELCDDCVHIIEDFEDDSLDHGITISGFDASIIGPDFSTGVDKLTDSVDSDDGSIDGVGNEAYSFFSPGNTLTITFASPVKSAGLVWTDGDIGTVTTFKAFGLDGTSLGSIGPNALSDSSFQGTTAEDRFFGAMDPNGVSYITVTNVGGTGIEIDHVQFSDCECVPEPSGLFLLIFGVLGLIGALRRR